MSFKNSPNRKKWSFLFLLSGASGFLLSLYLHQHPMPSPIAIRETVHYPALFVKQLYHDPEAGQKIYKEFCSACHSENPPIDVNAPRINDLATWKERSKNGDQILLMHTLNGKGAMPARGGCFECSDAQLKMAIEYILHKHF